MTAVDLIVHSTPPGLHRPSTYLQAFSGSSRIIPHACLGDCRKIAYQMPMVHQHPQPGEAAPEHLHRMPTWPSRHRDVDSFLIPVVALRAQPFTTSFRNTWRLISHWRRKETGMAVRCRPTSNGSSVVTWTAVSWPEASPGRVARNTAMILSSPIPAKGVRSVRRATPGAWWRRQRTWSITSSRRCRRASGCYRCRSGCAISFGTTVSPEGVEARGRKIHYSPGASAPAST